MSWYTFLKINNLRNYMANISSLWVGQPLSIAHKIALSSFSYYGHSLKLYVYDMDLEVPAGVTKVDANTIIPKSEIFLHYGKLAPFADYFRYRMIKQTSEMWVDADTICLSDYFFEDREYVFIEEMPDFFAQGILKMPSNSDLSNFLNERSSELIFERNESGNYHPSTWTPSDAKSWIYLGPALLTEAVKKFSLESYGVPALELSGIDISVSEENPYELLWNPANKDFMMERLKSSKSVTFFNSSLDMRGVGEYKNIITPDSMIWELYKKFLQ